MDLKIEMFYKTSLQILNDSFYFIFSIIIINLWQVESVALALNILDEYNLRGNKIRVQRAEFQMRGEYNPALKPKRKKKDKEKLQKMKEK